MTGFRRIVSALVLFMCAVGVAHAQNNFALNNGDRVVFYGDSITDQRLYTTWAESYIVTRFPSLDISFVHSGWGGDRVTGGGGGPIDLRLQRDVLAYKPTMVSIMLGMNDGGYRPFDAKLETTYVNGMQHIVDVLKKGDPGVRITIIQPSPFDDVTRAPNFEGGYNAVLQKYATDDATLAKNDGLMLADFNTPMVAMLQKADAIDPKLAERIIPDRVHPSPAGHMVMAEALVQAWGFPSVVSNVVIDAAGKTVVTADNTAVTDLKGDGTLTWTENDKCLPLPVELNDPLTALVLKSSDWATAIDQEMLKVTGLTQPQYALKINGVAVGTFKQEDLAAGINLGLLRTPMLQQAQLVYSLVRQHDDEHFARWRNIEVPYANNPSPDVQKAAAALCDALDQVEAETVKRMRAAAQPVTDTYELSPTK